jgi:hypothetical protein
MATTLTTANLTYPTSLSGTTISYVNGSAQWTQPTSHFNSSNGKPILTIPHGEEKVVVSEKAALEVNGTFLMNGVNLEERLSTIETVLQIPTRDVTMEAKHPKLAELYKQYMHELEKYKTWERIKGNDND